MISRHVQKLSRPAGLRASERPAIARWNVWLCRFDCAGSRTSTAYAFESAALSGSTEVIRPVASMATRTFFAQPFSGERIARKNRFRGSVHFFSLTRLT